MFDYLGEKVGALADSVKSTDLFNKKKEEKEKELGFGDLPEFAGAHNAPTPEADPNASAFASDFNRGGYGAEPSSFTNYFNPSKKVDPSAFDKDVGWRAGKEQENMKLGPGTYEEAKEEYGKPRDWSSLGEALMSIRLPQQQQVSSSGRVGGRFNFDRKIYENPLLTREYSQLYNAPLYTPLTK